MPAGDSLYNLRQDLARLRRDFDTFTGKYGPIVDSMQDADRVSKLLAQAARDTREAAQANSRVRLSRGQFYTAATVAGLAVLSFVNQVAHAVAHWVAK